MKRTRTETFILKRLRSLGVLTLKSPHSDYRCLYAHFVDNIGNARRYDRLEISPDRRRGVDLWETATGEDLPRASSMNQHDPA